MDARDPGARRLAQIERRLNEIGSMAKGNQAFQADRIADVLEQIEELRGELKTLSARVDRMAKFLNRQKNNNSSE